MTSLRKLALTGLFWSSIQYIGGGGITFIVMLFLTRLLNPEDFGLIGMLGIFIQLSQTISIAGFNQALIQKKNIDDIDYSTVFWLNLLISFLLYILSFFFAPLIAKFYNQNELIIITRVISIVFVINAFGYVQEAKLTKEMNFRQISILTIPSTIIGGLISLYLAKNQYGVFSIIYFQIITRLIFVVLLWINSSWKPHFKFEYYRAKQLFSFGGKILLSQTINTIYRNIYTVVLGKFFPLKNVGYYQTAQNIVQYPTSTFTSALASVGFSAFSKIQNNKVQVLNNYRLVIRQIFLWMCPIFLFSSILAYPLFQIVLTDKWLAAAPYFRILCVIGVFWPLNVMSLNLLNALGKSDLTLKLEIFKKLLITISLVISIPFGIKAVIFTQVVNSVIGYLLHSIYINREINYTFKYHFYDIFPSIMVAFIVGVIIYAILNLYLKDNITKLLLFPVGILIYITLVNYFCRKSINDIKMVFQKI